MTREHPAAMHRVVIVGGGFGGLECARGLRRSSVDVTLVDRRNFHLFQPLLYQVATGALSPANIAAPLRLLLKRARNCRVLMGEAVGVDAAGRRLLLRDGEIAYDSLVLAPGSRHHYFGHEEWEAVAPGLKTIEDATDMRRRVFCAFEAAERERDPARRERLLTFVVVGGGPTGVELAGALAEIAHRTMRGEFRAIAPEKSRIVLLEAGTRVLEPFDERLSARAALDLSHLGIDVRTSARVTAVDDGGVTVVEPAGERRIEAATVLWGAGVKAAPLAQAVARDTGVAPDRAGRLPVAHDCSLPGHAGIFVIGDAAAYIPSPGSRPLPGVAQTAMQQGRHVARVIAARVAGRSAPPPFRYRDLGTMAAIGKRRAVGEIAGWRIAGTFAWLMWVFLHVLKLATFQSRLLVALQWAWYWATWNRGARLITGDPADPERVAARARLEPQPSAPPAAAPPG